MRQRQHHRPRPTSLSALLLLGASFFTTPSSAVPYPKDDLHANGFGYLQPRGCAQYCGYQNQYCCSAGSTCMTQAGIAVCANGVAGGGGGWAFYTTTWTETETFTSTFSSAWAPATTATGGGGWGTGADCVPVEGSGQISCGSICCASDQYCAWKGQCYPNAPGGGGGSGGGGGASVTTTIVTGGQTITTQYSAPYRVTSETTVTQTGTSTSSGTGVLVSQTSTSSSGNGTVTTGTASSLSPGAIAGIVIGVLAGVALLLLICACFLVRGLWHGLLALLGLGAGAKKRRRHSETVIEEERYSRHGHSRPASVHSRRDTHGGWFGGGGGRPSTVSGRKEKKKSSGIGWLGLGAAAGTLLLLLGLRKDRKRQNRPAKTRSDVSSSYFGSDSYTASSPSEFF